MTALHRAAGGGHLQVVEYLLSKGAKVDSRDNVSTYNNVMYCVIAINLLTCSRQKTGFLNKYLKCHQPENWL